MKGVLIGSDLMYRQDGSLVPIEINTNVGWDVMNRMEREEDMWDFSFLRSYIKEHSITDVYLEGQIQRMKNFWPEDMGAEVHVITKEEMDESTDESEYHLYVRSAYSDEAYVDSFCRDKVNFLNAIQNLSFGCEYLLKTSGGLVGDITKVEDNGKLPNFLVKYRYPNYNKSKYPLAIRFDNVEKLKSWAEANLEEDYFIMPFYYDVDNLYKAEGEENSRIKLIRNWSLYIANDEGSLDSVYVASYTKLSAEIDESKIEWNEDGTCKDEETLHRMISSALWALADNLDVLLEADDVVLMEDDTWKEASELKTGLKVKAVTIPTSGTVDIHKSVEDYNVSFEELTASSSYTINEIKVVHKVEGWVSETVLNFTDGTDWFDSDASSYPVLDPKDQTVMFKKVGTIEAGDKVILMEAGATELEKPTFVIREVESTSKRRVLQKGYAISLDGNHLFLSKTSADAQAYISIEHNADKGGIIKGSACVQIFLGADCNPNDGYLGAFYLVSCYATFNCEPDVSTCYNGRHTCSASGKSYYVGTDTSGG